MASGYDQKSSVDNFCFQSGHECCGFRCESMCASCVSMLCSESQVGLLTGLVILTAQGLKARWFVCLVGGLEVHGLSWKPIVGQLLGRQH